MHKDCIVRGICHEFRIDLVLGKIGLSLSSFAFLAHTCPHVGVNSSGFADRILRMLGLGQFEIGKSLGEVRNNLGIQLITLGRAADEFHAKAIAGPGKARGDVIPIANPGECFSAELAKPFANRVKIGKCLTGVGAICETINDMAVGMICQGLNRGVSLGSSHNHIHHAAQHPGKILDTFPTAKPNVLPEQKAVAAQVCNAGFKADPRAERLFFEEQCEYSSRKE